MMIRSFILAPLVLSAAARLARRDLNELESPLDAKAQEIPEVNYAMQDLQDAMTIKSQFNNFLDRVNADTDKLRGALENQASKVSDLELEKQSLQSQMQNEKARLQHELDVFKQKMIAKITDLKTTNRRLEETNMQLVSNNDKLASELEAEKRKKEVLVKKLKKMATMFDKQQASVQNIIQQNSQRIESEVNSDVSDALNVATDNDSLSVPAATPAYTAPVHSPPMNSASEEEEDALKLPPGLDDDEEEAPVQHAMPKPQAQPVVAPQPKPAPAAHGGEIKKAVSAAASSAAAHARQAVAEAAAKAKATADAKVQAEKASKPKPAPKAAAPAPSVPQAAPKASADDEQLKALRSEVERLEDSVKNDDEAPSASMLHIHKKSAKVVTPVKKSEEGSDSVKTLQDVGGMLSAAMAEGDDDN
eukprot:gnl/MRDRNA2_/MRDRNA2_110798_c0_seq1.p1 gnl/MRDRNA2_/MRDRNA2_110798_c0~~gnl/MRDRNA2_/MRDRNA2_110798_c0_seq1.p1  ORF type:complete len:419 (-),score=155.41 gnl/MRDRNA2_/MRDRNA2_110798_c0_seq1:15-1271(-)